MTFRHGHGPVRVLGLHGWFGTGESWRDTIQWLDADMFSFAAPDYRGYGSRLDESGSYTLEEVAADMFAVADQLGWDDFDVIGHSMGGKAAQLMGAIEPARVRRIIGVTPVPPGPLPFDEQTMELFRGAPEDPSLRAAIINSTTGNVHAESFIQRLVAQSMAASRPGAVAGYLESWVGDDYSARVDGLSTPVRAIVGANDTAITAQVLEQAMMPFYPNGELTELPGCGHYPIHETPAALVTQLERLLRQAVVGAETLGPATP